MIPDMKLEDWQIKNKKTNRELASLLGIDVSLISHLKAGRRNPSSSLALRIEKLTRGKVLLKDLLLPRE